MSQASEASEVSEGDERAREVEQWAAARQRVDALVRGASSDALARPVPACPDWSHTDLLSHMVGLAADVLDGDEPDDHNERWTQAQVDARRGRPAADLLAEWDDLAPRLEAWMVDRGTRPLNDVVIHEQDLRGGLGAPGGRGSSGFAMVRDRMAGRVGAAVADLPPIALVATDEDWAWVSHGSVEDAAVRLEASGFDLGRALTTRRTAEQLRAWVVTGDVSAYLDAFAHLGDLPADPLPE